MFAKMDETKSKKWAQSSEKFASNVIVEELRHKSQQNNILKKEISEIYSEILQKCFTFRFLCILKTIAMLRKEAYQKMADDHSSKIARLLHRDVDVDEHIQNMSSYNLSFFDKLVLCRGLQFSIPEPRISAIDIQATFEKAFWKLEPILSENRKELAEATLRSIALNYTKSKGPKPPKPLVRSIQKLKKRDDIVITKPDKGSGVVVMDKLENIRLLNEASIDDLTKFRPVSQQKPTTRGRPPKYYHPLLAKEKHLESVVRKILPKEMADSVCKKGSRLSTYMAFLKRTKQLSRCGRSSQQLELTIMLSQSGWMKSWNPCRLTSIQSLMFSILPKKSNISNSTKMVFLSPMTSLLSSQMFLLTKQDLQHENQQRRPDRVTKRCHNVGSRWDHHWVHLWQTRSCVQLKRN